MILKAILIFFVVALADFLWAAYIRHIAEGNPLKSAIYAAFISAVGSIATIVYVSDHRMIVPMILGAFVGTYFSVYLRSKKEW